MANSILSLDPEYICDQVLEAVGHRAPPTDLDAVCSLWPDLNVEEEELDKEGYLIPYGVHGAEILLRRRDPPTRKKFTLAHELGHWAQAHLKVDQISLGKTEEPFTSFRISHKSHSSEEAWCNRFAACLLMPRKDMSDYLWASVESNLADRLFRGHSIFQVSAEAFLTRVSDITPINVFEVVTAEGNSRIRRKFLSKCFQRDLAEEAVAELLDTSNDLKVPPEGIVLGDQIIHTCIMHRSRYTRACLVAIAPLLND